MNTDVKKYIETVPAVAKAAKLEEVFWINPKKEEQKNWHITAVSPEDIQDAAARLQRFAPYLETVFPELKASGGIIESELRDIPKMKDFLNRSYEAGIQGNLLLKMDSD